MVSVGHVDQLEAVFTNAPLQERWKSMIKNAGTQLYLA